MRKPHDGGKVRLCGHAGQDATQRNGRDARALRDVGVLPVRAVYRLPKPRAPHVGHDQPSTMPVRTSNTWSKSSVTVTRSPLANVMRVPCSWPNGFAMKVWTCSPFKIGRAH